MTVELDMRLRLMCEKIIPLLTAQEEDQQPCPPPSFQDVSVLWHLLRARPAQQAVLCLKSSLELAIEDQFVFPWAEEDSGVGVTMEGETS